MESFFHGKAGFISAEWFPDFANYRRDSYDFDARYEDGLARYQDKQVYDILFEYTKSRNGKIYGWGWQDMQRRKPFSGKHLRIMFMSGARSSREKK